MRPVDGREPFDHLLDAIVAISEDQPHDPAAWWADEASQGGFVQMVFPGLSRYVARALLTMAGVEDLDAYDSFAKHTEVAVGGALVIVWIPGAEHHDNDPIGHGFVIYRRTFHLERMETREKFNDEMWGPLEDVARGLEWAQAQERPPAPRSGATVSHTG